MLDVKSEMKAKAHDNSKEELKSLQIECIMCNNRKRKHTHTKTKNVELEKKLPQALLQDYSILQFGNLLTLLSHLTSRRLQSYL